MWIPETEEEIIRAVESKSLEESATFDAKRELTGDNREIAKDIAAMANDGGVLLYGLGEDKNERPCKLNPIRLAGEPERISSIARTSISEPPRIIISKIRTQDDRAKGYIVVAVPASERAPHMVIVKGENRYYGRTSTGNKLLTEGEVARLYERRKKWEVDREALLSKEIANRPVPFEQEYAYLFLFAKPVASRENRLNEAIRDGQSREFVLRELVEMVEQHSVFPRDYSPYFSSMGRWFQRTDGLLARMGVDGTDEPRKMINLKIDFDGGGHLFCGRAADTINGALVFFPNLVAGGTVRFLTLLGELYDRAGYLGMVDMGVGITGLEGSVPASKGPVSRHLLVPYDQDEYRRTCRTLSLDLKDDPECVAKRLLMPIFNATSQNRIDPFDRH